MSPVNLVIPSRRIAASGVAPSAPAYNNQFSFLGDGVDEYFNGGNVLDWSALTPQSFSFWFKTGSTNTNRFPFSKRVGGTFIGYAVNLRNEGGNHQIWHQIIGSTGSLFWKQTGSLSLNTWYHVVITHDGTGTFAGSNLYIDGSAATIASTTDTLSGSASNSGNCELGKDAAGGNYFPGNLDEMGFWAIELSSDQVSDLYNSGTPPGVTELSFYNTTDCRAHFQMGDDAGDDFTATTGALVDVTGNLSDFTPTNTEAGDKVEDVP